MMSQSIKRIKRAELEKLYIKQSEKIRELTLALRLMWPHTNLKFMDKAELHHVTKIAEKYK